MGYAVRVPTSMTLSDNEGSHDARYASVSTDDDANVWDSYLSYLTKCARDAGVAARSALPVTV